MKLENELAADEMFDASECEILDVSEVRDPPPVPPPDASFVEDDEERDPPILLDRPERPNSNVWISREVSVAMTNEEWEAFFEQLTGFNLETMRREATQRRRR